MNESYFQFEDGVHEFYHDQSFAVRPEELTRHQWEFICRILRLDPDNTESAIINFKSVECMTGKFKKPNRPETAQEVFDIFVACPRVAEITREILELLRKAARKIMSLRGARPYSSIKLGAVDNDIFSELDITKSELSAIYDARPDLAAELNFTMAKKDPPENN